MVIILEGRGGPIVEWGSEGEIGDRSCFRRKEKREGVRVIIGKEIDI